MKQQRAPAPAGFREPRQIQPVPSPRLAKSLARQKLVGQPLDGGLPVHRGLLHENIDLFRRGRKPDQIVVKPAHQIHGSRVGGGLESRGFDFCQNEMVDIRLRPDRVLHRRWRRLVQGLIAPKLAAFLEAHPLLLFHYSAAARPRIGRAHLDPLLENGPFIIRQRLLRRHLQVPVSVADRLHQQALFRIAGDNGRTGVAALLPAFPAVQPQTALDLFLRAMAIEFASLHREAGRTFFQKIRARLTVEGKPVR